MIEKIRKNGFSLVEVLTVVTIVIISMLGLVSLVVQNIQVQSVNRNYLIASMLSQEGLELVRNVRDENWLDETLSGPDAWKNGMVLDGTYTIQYDGAIDQLANAVGDLAAKLYINGVGFYDHESGGTPTIFSRLITVSEEPASDPDHLIVSSKVEWQDRGKTYNYVSETYLYDWR